MSDRSSSQNLSRRQVMAGIGVAGMVLTQPATTALAGDEPADAERRVLRPLSVAAMKSLQPVEEGDWIETAGFHSPGIC